MSYFLFLDKWEKIYSGFILNWIKIKMKVLLKVFDISYYYFFLDLTYKIMTNKVNNNNKEKSAEKLSSRCSVETMSYQHCLPAG